MKELIEYDKESILSEEVFAEIFDQKDETVKARMIISFQDCAKDLGVKQKFDFLLNSYKKTDKEIKKEVARTAMVNNWTNFEGPYDNMKCGA